MSDEPTRSLGCENPGPTRFTAPAPDLPRRTPAPGIPARIGRYRILRVLGEGGMGTVYEAQQDQPKRVVALKVVRAGCLSPQLLKRFEHESHVLGRLQHPGIAQVYEAGTVHDERGHPVPFFAMEFIRGVPLTEYAASKSLGTRERLELVARICDAVYHAHQKGVIHRDLKPGNILVDESGQPKILDFGVARATDSDIQQTTLQTDIGQLIGTVPYMSPEQVSGDPGELDTRSDVYAIGVIAYEMLAERLPYDLRRKLIHEAARIIKEEEPTRLSSIKRTLRGDVETIVGKALEKDKARRYQSAESLAADIRRYLKDEPIAARPASTWYQVRKFSRRHRTLVAGVVASFVILLMGLGGTAWQGKIARDQRDVALKAQRAEARQRAEAETQRGIAQANAEAEAIARKHAEAINDFVTRALQSSDPYQLGAQGMTVTDAMTQALANLDRGDLKDQGAIVAGLLRTIALILDGNGKSAEAEVPAQRALAIEQELHPGDHPDVATSLNELAGILKSLGRVAEAEPLLVQALEMEERLYTGDHPDVAGTLSNLASVREALGRAAEAEPLFERALEMQQRLLKGNHESVATALCSLAYVRQSLGRPAEAEPLFERALEMYQHLYGHDHPNVATALSNLAAVRESLGRAAEAEPLYIQAVEMYQRFFKGDHPLVATGLNNLAHVRGSLGRAAEAEPLYVQALEMEQRLFTGDHPDVATALNNLAAVRKSLGRAAEAEQMYVQALEMRQRLFKDDHPDVAHSLSNLAGMRFSLGRAAEAEPLYEQAVEMWRRLYKGDHPEIAISLHNLARCLAADGHLPDALARATDAAEMSGRMLPQDHPIRKACDEALAAIRKKIEDAGSEPAPPK